MKENDVQLTILLPCLNEEANIQFCIEEAQSYLASRALSGEVLIVDNGSTDLSPSIAASLGARVVSEPIRGYGSALRRGLAEARGQVVIFADADSTYSFADLDPFYLPLSSSTADVVIGRRVPEKGAMPLSHRIGVAVLSWLGRLRFGVKVRDFHCGLRGITHAALDRMKLTTVGMEFATEFIAESRGLRIGEVEVVLRKSRALRRAHLRAVRDGWRHLVYIWSRHRL